MKPRANHALEPTAAGELLRLAAPSSLRLGGGST